MANWSNPSGNTSSYLDILNELKARDVDALSHFKSAGSNVPTGAIRFVRKSNNKIDIQEWSGTTWTTKLISSASGGFDSSTSLGTMSTQNSNNVNITGGSVAASVLTGTINTSRIPNLPASRINSGAFNSARIPNLPASKINSGTFNIARIPNLDADKINNGTFNSDRIPSLAASKINSGVVAAARLGSGTADITKTLLGNNTWGDRFVANRNAARLDADISFDSNSDDFTDILSVTLSLRDSSHKVRIGALLFWTRNRTQMSFVIRRGSTQITDIQSLRSGSETDTDNSKEPISVFPLYDDPATTAEQTYTIAARRTGSEGSGSRIAIIEVGTSIGVEEW